MDALEKIDWSLIQSFLAVADTGSLSGAARRLGLSQPTVGRQVQALEDRLGATLFHRKPRGMALAEAGRDLIGPARAMQQAAAALALAAAGADGEMTGTVRITASAFNAFHHLPAILSRLRREAPEIQIELVSSDTSENLLFREADIALRMYRPTQLDMVTRHLGGLELGLFVPRALLEGGPVPDTAEAALALPIVGYDRDERLIRGLQDFGVAVDRDFFPLRTDDNLVNFELMRAGCGAAFAQVSVAAQDPSLVRLLPDLPIPALPVWLTCHEALRRVPRVRKVWGALEQGMAPHLLAPDHPLCRGGA